MAGLLDACAADDVQSSVSFCRPDRFSRVDADADPHGPALRPVLSSEGALDRHGRGDRLRSAGEHHEERVPLGINLVTLVSGKRGPQQGTVDGQDRRVAVSEVHRQHGAVLDVRVQHRKGAAGQFRHDYAHLGRDGLWARSGKPRPLGRQPKAAAG